MKNPFASISTTSIIAVLIILFGFLLLGIMVLTGLPEDDTRAVQFTTGIFGIMGIAAAYYFSASKRGGMTQQADTITNTNPPADSNNATPNPQ